MSSLKKESILSSFYTIFISLKLGLNLFYLILDISKILWVVKTNYYKQIPIIYTFFSAVSFCPYVYSAILLFNYINAFNGVNKLWAIELINIFENFSVVFALLNLL